MKKSTRIAFLLVTQHAVSQKSKKQKMVYILLLFHTTNPKIILGERYMEV